ncbi:MAG: hypothetical protein K6G03_08930, partial [Lachnospiraceae bacterium]|nr:hypothetical protein [Lachnospiraceae bacterium]
MNIRIRFFACLAVLSILISVILLSGAISHMKHDPEYTSYNDGIATTAGVYFMENWNQSGRVYLMEDTGDVLHMINSKAVGMDEVNAIEVANDSLLAVFSSVYTVDDRPYGVYRVGLYDPDMQILSITDPFLIDADERVRAVNYTDQAACITTISEQGYKVNVYNIPEDAFMSVEDDEGIGLNEKDVAEYLKDITGLSYPDSIMYRESTGGRIFWDAFYDEGTLFIRTDEDKPTGYFAPDMRVKNTVDNIHFSITQQLTLYANFIIWWVGGLLIWFVAVVMMWLAIRKRNRTVYVAITVELVLLIVLAGAFIFVKNSYSRSEKIQNIRYGVMELQSTLDRMTDLNTVNFEDKDFYNSDIYLTMLNRLRGIVWRGSNSSVFQDVWVYHIKSGTMIVDARGCNGQSASFVYGGVMSDLQDDLLDHETISSESYIMNGSQMSAVAVTGDRPNTAYALVANCYDISNSTGFWSDSSEVLKLFVVVFLLGSLVIIFVFYLQSLDLKNFEHAIREVALGRTKISVPDTPAQDMKAMWNALSEYCKRVEEMSYEKFMIFEGYYRFAPKNVEKIMGKDSIFEVQNGDITSVKGTLMLLSTERKEFSEKRVKSLVNIISYMNQVQEKEEGVLVSQDSSLAVLQFLFLEDENHAVSIATQFIHRNAADRGAEPVSALLYN